MTHITIHLLRASYKIPQNSNENVVFAYFILNNLDVVCFFKYSLDSCVKFVNFVELTCLQNV